MFRELMELGRRLEADKKLPSPGYYDYSSQPIKWIVHLQYSQPDFVYIEDVSLEKPRPFCGRRSDIQAHPVADEAGYALGVDRQKGGGSDEKTQDKHSHYLNLLEKAKRSASTNNDTKTTIGVLYERLSIGLVKKDNRYKDILNKDWISFVFDDGPFAQKHLYELPEIQQFWQDELKDRTRQDTDTGKAKTGVCSICGQQLQMAKKIPVGVKLYKPNPFHSYNIDSFVSHLTGTQVFKKAHLGQCVICGDAIARTLNYLRNQRCKIITQDKSKGKLNTDSPRNQFALFWLKEERPVKVGEAIIDTAELMRQTTLIMGSASSVEAAAPPPDLSQLENMLNVPWTGTDTATRLAENAFYLLVLSPNKGRIAVRDWFDVSLDRLQQNLKSFLDAQRIVDPKGIEKRCFGLPEILKAIESANISKEAYKATEIANPNISRGLLRTAYLGEPPPVALLEAAVMCMRNPKIFDKPGIQHIVMSTLKLVLTHKKEDMVKMETLDKSRDNPGCLCGRLLAILEEAQLRAARWKINTTLVDRFYGSASSAPASVFGTLVSRATTDHFPKIRKNQLGYQDLEARMESVQTAIKGVGGYPKTCKLKEQAEFSLGFYLQRAEFSAIREQKKLNKIKEEGNE